MALARREHRGLKELAAQRVAYDPVAITEEGSQLIGTLEDGRSVIVNGHDRAWLRSRRGKVRPDGDFTVVTRPNDQWYCVLRYDDGSDPARAVVDVDPKLPYFPPGPAD